MARSGSPLRADWIARRGRVGLSIFLFRLPATTLLEARRGDGDRLGASLAKGRSPRCMWPPPAMTPRSSQSQIDAAVTPNGGSDAIMREIVRLGEACGVNVREQGPWRRGREFGNHAPGQGGEPQSAGGRGHSEARRGLVLRRCSGRTTRPLRLLDPVCRQRAARLQQRSARITSCHFGRDRSRERKEAAAYTGRIIQTFGPWGSPENMMRSDPQRTRNSSLLGPEGKPARPIQRGDDEISRVRSAGSAGTPYRSQGRIE